jgi:hypothetical protein
MRPVLPFYFHFLGMRCILNFLNTQFQPVQVVFKCVGGLRFKIPQRILITLRIINADKPKMRVSIMNTLQPLAESKN